MNTTNITREQISAFADGELSDGHLDVTLAALRQDEGRDAWNLYHQVGDALRSDELNTQLSAGFNARMFALLDAEPVIMVSADKRVAVAKETSIRRFAMPGMAAAAVAVVAFLTVPQMMTPITAPTLAANPAPVVASAAAPETITVASQDGEVLRDPRIDEYLLAHQRFSPSVYSTAQYARSATFAVDSDK
ncbi:MAG TPA: sigma-E factor negative regulatory protein [Oxalicibacterium sp.]|uniref:sigma-E factor negative regulatory protein n=1 Tax=Oxalicibacterium sp. TaxID=2766525 RepID=UPI002BF0B487|nr:sigma-E factor negative regulatory protein [Oxalicibacterium sp.]HWU98583.1 sigma-E factor negative regulatory protein [Oxalicibacterium sp.]